jgi:uncharacterized protein YdiU (UPF0061 family)
LKDIADGILKWNDIDISTLPAIRDKIKQVLSTIPDAFASLARENEDTGYDPDDLEDGIDLAKDLADPLNSLIDTLNSMSTTYETYVASSQAFGQSFYGTAMYLKKGLDMITDSDIDKLEALVTPLEKLAMAIKNFNPLFKDQIAIFRTVETTYFEKFKDWASALYKLSQIDIVKSKSTADHYLEKFEESTKKLKEQGVSEQDIKTQNQQFVDSEDAMEDIKDLIKDLVALNRTMASSIINLAGINNSIIEELQDMNTRLSGVLKVSEQT